MSRPVTYRAMTYLNALVALIEDAYSDLFKNAEALKDHLDYQPAPTCRTPISILNECVTSPVFLAATIQNRVLAPMGEETWEKEGLATVEACRAAWDEAKPALYAAIEGFPAEMLLEKIETPWGTFTWRDFIAYAYWNVMWHAGQLAYIQTIHGDTDMHF